MTDKPPNYEQYCQTDFDPEPVQLRYYMPEKLGKDKETQIWDSDIFNFDKEVEPILNVICNKTLQISALEVREEEELKFMKSE